MPQFSRIFLGIALLATQLEASQVGTNISAGGQVVWWGNDIFWNDPRLPRRDHTNGIVEEDGDFLQNVVAIAAHSDALILRSDGTVFARGLNSSEGRFEPAALSNVVSIVANETACWAIKRDGTVTGWGIDIENGDKTIGSLSNVASIAQGGPNSVFVLKNNGSAKVLYAKALANEREIDPLTGMPISEDEPNEMTALNDQGSSNVVAIAFDSTHGFLGLGKDGTITAKGSKLQIFDPATGLHPSKRFPPGPLSINGQVLSNVVAIAAGNPHCITLRQDGTVMAWGSGYGSQTDVPPGLSNVIAIAAGSQHSLALRRDGTVVAWGADYSGQASVPARLSNVVAIAAGGDFSLALIAGPSPASVYIQPHGRLEELEREADFIFKGQVISTKPAKNTSFPDWGKPHATQFKVISVLKGSTVTNAPIFWHNTSGPMGWGGGRPPSWHQFEPGKFYLVFAVRLDKSAYLYNPPPGATNRPGEFRQTYNDGVTRTLGDSPVKIIGIKAAHWAEFELLLKDLDATNQMYAIEQLDSLSYAGRPDDEWARAADFKRAAVLKVLLPLTTNIDQQVAVRAIKCFAVETNGIVHLKPFSGALVDIANNGASARRRLQAIYSLSGLCGDAVTNSLLRLLEDPDENIRAGAVRLLPRFPFGYAEPALRERSDDKSAIVRAVVADVIGEENYIHFLPLLAKLFSDSAGKIPQIEPLAMVILKAGEQWDNVGDVHASAGFALLKFEVVQTRAILETNLSDEGFSLSFMKKLAPDGAESYLPRLAEELKNRAATSEIEAEKNGFHWDLSYLLRGNLGWAWDTVFAYVSLQPRQTLATKRIISMLDALQIADDPADVRTRTLYEFYLDKGMKERAVALRLGIKRRTEDKAINKQSFNFPDKLKAFDEIDEKHSLKPGLGVQFNLE